MRANIESHAKELASSVSVVIPSYKRHEEVARAVESVICQSFSPLEIIVVNDGPDVVKGRLLNKFDDNRLKFVEAPRYGNVSSTRNYGIEKSRGDWVALLDDDDVWLSDKLKNQFITLARSDVEVAILAGVERIYMSGGATRNRPRIVSSSVISSVDMLFSTGSGVNTSTIVAPINCFRSYPFNVESTQLEDVEWLLNAGQDLPLVLTSSVVCERWFRPGEGLSHPGDFVGAWQWYLRNRSLMSRRTRGYFVSRVLSRRAAYDRNARALGRLIGELIFTKNISSLGSLLFPWLVPYRLRQNLRYKK